MVSDDLYMLFYGLKQFLMNFNEKSSKFDENWCESMRADENE